MRRLVVGPFAARERYTKRAADHLERARQHGERVVRGEELVVVRQRQRAARDRARVRARAQRVGRQPGVTEVARVGRRFFVRRAADIRIRQRRGQRTAVRVGDLLVVRLHRQRRGRDLQRAFVRRDHIVRCLRGGVERRNRERVCLRADVRDRTRRRWRGRKAVRADKVVAAARDRRVRQRAAVVRLLRVRRGQRDRPWRHRDLRAVKRGLVVRVRRHEVDRLFARVRDRRARRQRVVRRVRAVGFRVHHRRERLVCRGGDAVFGTVVLRAVARRVHVQPVRGRDRQLALGHQDRVVRRRRTGLERVVKAVVHRARVRDRAVRRRGRKALRAVEAVAACVLGIPRVRQRRAVVRLRRGIRRDLDDPRVDLDRRAAVHRQVVRVRHHEVHRRARRVIRPRRVRRQRVVGRLRALRVAVRDRRSVRNVRRDRDSVRQAVVLLVVARSRRAGRRGLDL